MTLLTLITDCRVTDAQDFKVLHSFAGGYDATDGSYRIGRSSLNGESRRIRMALLPSRGNILWTMPSRVEILAIYLGSHPMAQLNMPAQPLELPQSINDDLLRSIRNDLLKSPSGFTRTVRMAELTPLELEWVAAGQTAGVAIWSRRGNKAGSRLAGGASLVLTGLDEGTERSEILAAMAARRLPVPPDINSKLEKDARRPLAVNLFYHLNFFFDPFLATVAPALANTFFALLGTNIEHDSQAE